MFRFLTSISVSTVILKLGNVEFENILSSYISYDRIQVEEGTCGVLLLIDKQLTTTGGIFLSAFLPLEQLNHCVGLFCPHHWVD